MITLNKGFTLIELMIVIAVIGILALIATPFYQNYIARAQIAEALSLLAGQKAAVAEYYSMYNKCPDNRQLAVGGLAKASDISGKYVSSVSVSDGHLRFVDYEDGQRIFLACFVIAVMKSSGVAKPVQGQTVSLGMGFTELSERKSISWACSSSVPPQYLPAVCRVSGIGQVPSP